MEIQIEFGGFYGYHDEYIDCRIEQFNDGVIYENDCYDIDNIDWQKTFKDYAENWLHRFNMFCHLSLKFVGIDRILHGL